MRISFIQAKNAIAEPCGQVDVFAIGFVADRSGSRLRPARPARVTKSVILMTPLSGRAARRKCLSCYDLEALIRRETPLSGGASAKNETGFVFWRAEKPVGIGFSRFRRGPLGGLNLRRKATT